MEVRSGMSPDPVLGVQRVVATLLGPLGRRDGNGLPFPESCCTLGLLGPCKFGMAHTCDKINGFGGSLWHSILRAPRMRLGRENGKFTTHTPAKCHGTRPVGGMLYSPPVFHSVASHLWLHSVFTEIYFITGPAMGRCRWHTRTHMLSEEKMSSETWHSRCNDNPHAQELKLMD